MYQFRNNKSRAEQNKNSIFVNDTAQKYPIIFDRIIFLGKAILKYIGMFNRCFILNRAFFEPINSN